MLRKCGLGERLGYMDRIRILGTEKPGFEWGWSLLRDPEKVRILWEWKGWHPPHCDPPIYPDLLHRLFHEPSPIFRPCGGHESVQPLSLGECGPSPAPGWAVWQHTELKVQK